MKLKKVYLVHQMSIAGNHTSFWNTDNEQVKELYWDVGSMCAVVKLETATGLIPSSNIKHMEAVADAFKEIVGPAKGDSGGEGQVSGGNGQDGNSQRDSSKGKR